MAKDIALVGDPGYHMGVQRGTITSSNQDDNALTVGGTLVAVAGAMFNCTLHGPNKPIVPITIKSFHNGKLIVTTGAIADPINCGAIIIPPVRGVIVE